MRGDRQGTFASDFTLSATPFQQNLIYPRNATTIVIVELGTNDSIAGYVKCITDDTDAIIIDYQLTITEV